VKNLIYTFIALILVGSSTYGASYYCDPAAGKMSNPGTSDLPWSALEAVFAANKTFAAGDTIFLRKGYHGFPTVKGINSGYVTIKPQGNDTVKVKKLIVQNAAKWVISGLTISPEVVSSYEGGNFVDIQSTSSYITLENCFIYSTLNAAGWTQSDYGTKTGNGIECDAPNCFITNNNLKNILNGIEIQQAAAYTVVSYNTIDRIVNDGIRGLADYSKYEYNIVKNLMVYRDDDVQDACFQSWSRGADGQVGTGTVYGVELRGNIFISTEDPDLPFKAVDEVNGIACHNGMLAGWVIENNLILVNHWIALALYGAMNCTILNNTVAELPGYTGTNPWISLGAHKNGTPATGNLVRNNFTSAMANDENIGTVDHNIVSTAYTSNFENYAGFNCHLKAGSPAIDAGNSTDAPTIDRDGNLRPQGVAYDVGAYEFVAGLGGDNQAPSTPTGLASSNITLTSFTLSWTASTDNVGIAGYQAFRNGSDAIVVTSTSANISALTASTQYTYTVKAFDADGNESEMSSGIDVTTLTGDAVTSRDASSTWQSFDISTQKGTFTAFFDAVPHTANMDGLIGIQNGIAVGYRSLACNVRFYRNGLIDARNGEGYGTRTVSYTAGTSYHFRLVIDVPAHTYSIYVTPSGGTEVVFGTYAFRTEQSNVTQLTGWSVISDVGAFTVSNIKFEHISGFEK